MNITLSLSTCSSLPSLPHTLYTHTHAHAQHTPCTFAGSAVVVWTLPLDSVLDALDEVVLFLVPVVRGTTVVTFSVTNGSVVVDSTVVGALVVVLVVVVSSRSVSAEVPFEALVVLLALANTSLDSLPPFVGRSLLLCAAADELPNLLSANARLFRYSSPLLFTEAAVSRTLICCEGVFTTSSSETITIIQVTQLYNWKS